MQEPSVSSTTASPGQRIVPVKNKEIVMEISDISFAESKIQPEKQVYTCEKVDKREGAHKHRHSKHRYHTCSKARRKKYSSGQKCSRQTRSRRKHRRSRRSRSSSRHHSSSRRHKRHYKSSDSSSRSSSLSNASVRSSDCLAPPSQVYTDMSRDDYLDNKHKLVPAALHSYNVQQCDEVSRNLPGVTKSEVTIEKEFGGLSQILQTNPTTNDLLKLLINGLNSPNQLPSSIIDLLGTALPSIIPSSSVSSSFASSVPLSATRQARRLYVGSIPAGVTSESMVTFFNTELRSRGLSQGAGDPVISAQVNSERHFAFIELRSVDETTTALHLDGISCMGNSLRVRRPRDYMAHNLAAHPSNSNVSGDHLSANSVFISGIPNNMQETHLRCLLNAFGPLRSFNLLLDPATGALRGCGFFEFSTIDAAERASSGLMNLPVYDGKLFAIRADLLAGPITPSSFSTATPVVSNVSSPTPITFGGDDLREVTPILCLTNMVTPSEIVLDEDYAEILDDVRSECARHGRVRSIQMSRDSGRIYVEFVAIADAIAVRQALSGRKFNGRTVAVCFFDVQAYTRRDF